MKKALLAVMLVPITACVGVADLAPGKTGKSFTVSGKSYDDVWNAAVKSVRAADGKQMLDVEKSLNIKIEEKEEGVIKADSPEGIWGGGEVVAVFISPATDAPEYKIEVESRTKVIGNVTGNNWESEIINSIKTKLNTK